jgi:hypothetical protein
LAIPWGRWFADGDRATVSPVAEVSRISDWIAAHQQAALACYVLALLLAYITASGRRVS